MTLMPATQPDPHNVRVGRNLRTRREMSGWRVGELAAALQPSPVTANYLSQIESGRKRLTPVVAAKVAAVLNVDPQLLLNPPDDQDEEPSLAAAS